MESRYLLILEISQKQAYVFGSRRLRDNLNRSEYIRQATSPAFFAACCGADFSEEENLVYSGGGHTVLQFDGPERARRAAGKISSEVLRRWPGMEMFVKLREYDPGKTPGENLNALSAALEAKKALRLASFHRGSFGIDVGSRHAEARKPDAEDRDGFFREWRLTADGEQLAGDDNFLAVVHIDGNSMGSRVQNIYKRAAGDWDGCRSLLRQFSEEIDRHYREAYEEMCADLAEKLPSLGWNAVKNRFPVRRIINAGDDVCFVCAGKLGLSCATSFLRHLNVKKNGADGLPYAACAGVCLIHKKYPFRPAYDMSEQLCSSAKRFGASCDPTGAICAIDWHVEFGQLKNSLSEIRSDYRTDDGGQLELRPYAVLGGEVPPLRRFSFFRKVLRQLSEETENLPRSKMKALREAFRQGETETRLALRSAGLEDLLDLGVEERIPDWKERTVRYGTVEKAAFVTDGDKRRCLYFDAIELMDHILLWEEDAK